MPPVKYAVAIKSCHKYADRAAAQREVTVLTGAAADAHVLAVAQECAANGGKSAAEFLAEQAAKLPK